MDDLSGLLEQVLHDPQKMQEVFSLAQALGAMPPDAGQESAPAAGPDLSPLISLAGSAGDSRQEALIRALRPYLRPERQKSLERAIRAARAGRIARMAIQAMQSKSEEEGHV